MNQPMLCERCSSPLAGSWSTQAYSATGQTIQVAPDGSSAIFPLGGFIACSWNCLAVLAAQRAGTTADAAVRIVAERERQVTTEGYTPEHDRDHHDGQLALAGICYAGQHAAIREHAFIETDQDIGTASEGAPGAWPWDPEWWKPKDPQRDLVRAGALIAAEADRTGERS